MTTDAADFYAPRLPELTRVCAGASPAVPWTAITDDSRAVVPGGLFVARGKWDARSAGFVQAAVERGAAALLLPADAPWKNLSDRVAVYTAAVVDQPLAGRVADVFFGEPQKGLRLVGVTGTNGKTTVAMMARHLLAASGFRCGLLGTIWTDVGDEAGPRPSRLTTPGAIELRALLAEMVANGCTSAVMEVSSHALDQGRTAGLVFDAAVFTNLTQDHLDYHGTMADYADAKAKLFTQLVPQGCAVLNAQDSASEQMARCVSAERVWWTLQGETREKRDRGACLVTPLEETAAGTRARFDGPWGSASATLPMVGPHNLSNALQAAAAAHALAAQTAEELGRRLEAMPPVPGRLEPVGRVDGRGPAVLVDYAHTPDAIERAASAVRAVTRGRVVVVYGCGGDRDRTKRPLMTSAALLHADVAVLTSDNPRSEDPQKILDDALRGVPAAQRAKLRVRVDRAEAIRLAVREAGEGDAVLIAGKGHEDYQVVAELPGVFGGGTKTLHLDDREQARAALEQWSPPPPPPESPESPEPPEGKQEGAQG